MAYTPKTWANGELITAEGLNRIEKGISDPPAAHKHPVSDVTGLADRLAAQEYDSGVRSLAKPAGVDGDVLCRRLGSVVEVNVDSLRGVTGTITIPSTLPIGMRPLRTIRVPLSTGATLNVSSSGQITLTGITSAAAWHYGQVVFIPSAKAAPTTLPGNPA